MRCTSITFAHKGFNLLLDTRTCFRFLAITLALTLTACGTSQPSPTPTLAPVSETSAPPTETPIPAVATVNGEAIPLDEFNAELLRFQNAQTVLGETISVEEAEERVLNDLIVQLLLAQGAHEDGYALTDAELNARINGLAVDIGGEENLSTWLANHGYTSESFQSSTRKAVESPWMRDKILAELPSTAEQVHAQQILLYNQETAEEIQTRLEAGVDFGDLASAYDPRTNGELGWFPRGYLLEKNIEDIAFSLEIEQSSKTIETEVGFHIIMVLEHETDRALSPDALLALQEKTLGNWVQERREASKIEQ